MTDEQAEVFWQRARDMSEWLRPPWWKLRARRQWRKYQQPLHIFEWYRDVLIGEMEPDQRYGWSVK